MALRFLLRFPAFSQKEQNGPFFTFPWRFQKFLAALLSHGEEFEEMVRLASEAAARFDLYIELLCLEAADRAVVDYFDVGAAAAAEAARAARAVRAAAAAARASAAARSAAAKETQSARELGGIAVAVGGYYTSSVVALSCMCALGGALSCVSWMSTRT